MEMLEEISTSILENRGHTRTEINQLSIEVRRIASDVRAIRLHVGMQHPDNEAKFGDNVNVNLMPRFEVKKSIIIL
jgi:hypothetical protein